VSAQQGDGERLEAEVRGVLADLSSRIGSMGERLDGLDARSVDHDSLLSSLSRTVAPPTEE
jgi:hypothetical protein